MVQTWKPRLSDCRDVLNCQVCHVIFVDYKKGFKSTMQYIYIHYIIYVLKL